MENYKTPKDSNLKNEAHSPDPKKVNEKLFHLTEEELADLYSGKDSDELYGK